MKKRYKFKLTKIYILILKIKMFFLTHHIVLSSNSTMDLISSYKNIRIKFILMYIKKNISNKNLKSNKSYLDALIYSKYYLYWKIYGCVYSDEIMNLLYDVEFMC